MANRATLQLTKRGAVKEIFIAARNAIALYFQGERPLEEKRMASQLLSLMQKNIDWASPAGLAPKSGRKAKLRQMIFRNGYVLKIPSSNVAPTIFEGDYHYHFRSVKARINLSKEEPFTLKVESKSKSSFKDFDRFKFAVQSAAAFSEYNAIYKNSELVWVSLKQELFSSKKQ